MERIRDDEKEIAEIEERERLKKEWQLWENGIRIPKIHETTITPQQTSKVIAELPDFPYTRDDEKEISEIEERERKRIKEFYENGILTHKMNETTITPQQTSDIIAGLSDFSMKRKRSNERKLSRKFY